MARQCRRQRHEPLVRIIPEGWEPMTQKQRDQSELWEYFRREAITDGLPLDEAAEYATLMTT